VVNNVVTNFLPHRKLPNGRKAQSSQRYGVQECRHQGQGDPNVVLEKIHSVVHASAGITPRSLEPGDVKRTRRFEAGLTSGHGDQVLQVNTQIKVKTDFFALALKCLKGMERVLLLRSDLGQSKI